MMYYSESEAFESVFLLVFLIMIGIFVFNLFRSISEYADNNQLPVLSVEATVTGKRISINRRNNTTSTSYYATFEVESGDRIEFRVNGKEYGMLRENDYGRVTFQGTHYIDFEQYPEAI